MTREEAIQRTSNAEKKHVENTLEDAVSREDAEAIFRNARMALMEQDRKEHIKDFETRELMLLNAEQFIHLLPSVQPKSETVTEFADRCRECGKRYVKRQTGHWIDHQEGRWIYAKCSECGSIHDVKSDYCPNCGAHMVEPYKADKE